MTTNNINCITKIAPNILPLYQYLTFSDLCRLKLVSKFFNQEGSKPYVKKCIRVMILNGNMDPEFIRAKKDELHQDVRLDMSNLNPYYPTIPSFREYKGPLTQYDVIENFSDAHLGTTLLARVERNTIKFLDVRNISEDLFGMGGFLGSFSTIVGSALPYHEALQGDGVLPLVKGLSLGMAGGISIAFVSSYIDGCAVGPSASISRIKAVFARIMGAVTVGLIESIGAITVAEIADLSGSEHVKLAGVLGTAAMVIVVVSGSCFKPTQKLYTRATNSFFRCLNIYDHG